MTPDELRSISNSLFGPRWQTSLARFLKHDDGKHVNPRTVRRWAKGDLPVPAAVALLLRAELERRAPS
jgi:hypothetical protein